MLIKGIIFDWRRTLYNPVNGSLMDGAKQLLNFLKKNKYKLALVTSSADEKARVEQVKKFGLYGYFDSITISPAKDVKDFLKAMREMDVGKENALVVGDSIYSEISTTKIMGLKTVWLLSGEPPETDDEEPDSVIERLADLKNILDKLNR